MGQKVGTAFDLLINIEGVNVFVPESRSDEQPPSMCVVMVDASSPNSSDLPDSHLLKAHRPLLRFRANQLFGFETPSEVALNLRGLTLQLEVEGEALPRFQNQDEELDGVVDLRDVFDGFQQAAESWVGPNPPESVAGRFMFDAGILEPDVSRVSDEPLHVAGTLGEGAVQRLASRMRLRVPRITRCRILGGRHGEQPDEFVLQLQPLPGNDQLTLTLSNDCHEEECPHDHEHIDHDFAWLYTLLPPEQLQSVVKKIGREPLPVPSRTDS